MGDSCKSEPNLNLANYKTQYEINYPQRPYSPRVPPIKRPPNIRMNPGVMDIFSETYSKFKAYPEDVVSRARPPAVRKANNLFLTGENNHIPEYRSSYVHHNIDSVFEHNKPSCGHYIARQEKLKKKNSERDQGDMPERVTRMCSSNSYEDERYRYHQRIDNEKNFTPEYRRQYKPIIGQRSTMIPQRNNLNVCDDGSLFGGSSEYTNRYKTFEQHVKSQPVRKQDNLHVQRVKNQTQPEYTERYREVDMNSYERRQPYRRQDNLHTEGDFSREAPEYHEKFRQPHASSYPERAKGREDFLALEGEMAYSPEYRKNYVEFPRQRPIVRRPPSNVQMPTAAIERERRPEKVVDLPIDVVTYHGNGGGSTRLSRVRSDDSDDLPLEARPEYRKAMKYNLIKERSPSRGSVRSEKSKSPPDAKRDKNANNVKVQESGETAKILSENAAKMKQQDMFNENNEVIVEPLKRPENFKIPTRSPDKIPLGKAPSYPIERQKLYKEDNTNLNKRRPLMRKPMKVTIDQIDNECTLSDDEPAPPRREFVDTSFVPPPYYHPPPNQQLEAMKKSPKFGRRATNPVEAYNLRTKTSVIEANPRYANERRRDIVPNCHQRNAYHCISHQAPAQMPQARPPAEPLATNYYPNYEINKQSNYRESLRDERNPFLVINNGAHHGKPNSWMKKSWYDTH